MEDAKTKMNRAPALTARDVLPEVLADTLKRIADKDKGSQRAAQARELLALLGGPVDTKADAAEGEVVNRAFAFCVRYR